MATRDPPVELFYDPADLDPSAPRLYVRKENGAWALWDGTGVLLGRHSTLPDALDDALARSGERFSEILVRTATGTQEWSVAHNPELEWLARAVARERERGCWPSSLETAMAAGVRLTFDPAEVDPGAPKLHVRQEGGEWEVRSATGVLSRHPTQEEALAAARDGGRTCGAEIFFESRSGQFVHRMARSPAELRYLEVWQSIHDDHHDLSH